MIRNLYDCASLDRWRDSGAKYPDAVIAPARDLIGAENWAGIAYTYCTAKLLCKPESQTQLDATGIKLRQVQAANALVRQPAVASDDRDVDIRRAAPVGLAKI
ncbi:hypothetical protein BH11PSE12_BH11PSE12_10980 [soil metagenome]